MRLKTMFILVELFIAFIAIAVLLWFMIPKFLAAQNINIPARVPDPNLRKAIEKFMGIEPGGRIAVSQAAAKTGMFHCSGQRIKNLKGIEYFTGITILRCAQNQLTTLDVSNNTALTELVCSHNELTRLDISDNPLLVRLDCSVNRLTSLDLSKALALIRLDCSVNQLSELDLSANTSLRAVNCLGNELTV
ncbi:MAG: hypothetical protein ABIH23_23610, partial [bacterium]